MLSEKAREIYAYIVRCVEERGLPPSIREICDDFGMRSTNGALHHLSKLESAGYIRRHPHKSRAIELLLAPRANAQGSTARAGVSGMGGIPILGRVAAGLPIEAQEEIEGHLTLEEVFPAREDLFALRVRGQSMRDAGILDGDLVVVRRQEYARDGDRVVAVVGTEATVKTFRRTTEGAELHPANDDFDVLRVRPEDDFQVLGVVVGLVRPPVAGGRI
jgi:repressor LexA